MDLGQGCWRVALYVGTDDHAGIHCERARKRPPDHHRSGRHDRKTDGCADRGYGSPPTQPRDSAAVEGQGSGQTGDDGRGRDDRADPVTGLLQCRRLLRHRSFPLLEGQGVSLWVPRRTRHAAKGMSMGACCGRCWSASTSSACRGFVEVPTSPSRGFTRASRGDLRSRGHADELFVPFIREGLDVPLMDVGDAVGVHE